MAAAQLRQHVSLRTKIVLAAALALYAVIATGSAADRLSAGDPVLAAKVPALFASEALRTLGGEALSGGKAIDAATIGAAAIDNAPTDPQSTALFGAGKLAAGNRALADTAFRVAGQLGWRVPITQSYWMGQALTEGKYDIAALRLDALLRQQPALLRQRQLVDPMERNPAGVSAMIARMRLQPAWLGFYATDVSDLPADVVLQRAEVLDQAARAGLVLGCDRIGPLAARLAVVGQVRTGSAIWRQHCLAAGTGLVSDERLGMLDIAGKPVAFGWQLIGNSGLTLAVVPAGKGSGQRLLIDGTSDLTRPVLTQLLALEPGRYRLSWRSSTDEEHTSDRVVAGLACPGDLPVWAAPVLDRVANLWRADVAVDARCTAQQLVFAAAPRPGRVWLEQIALVRVP